MLRVLTPFLDTITAELEVSQSRIEILGTSPPQSPGGKWVQGSVKDLTEVPGTQIDLFWMRRATQIAPTSYWDRWGKGNDVLSRLWHRDSVKSWLSEGIPS